MQMYRLLPTDAQQAALAQLSQQVLAHQLRRDETLSVRLLDHEHEVVLELPAEVARLLLYALDAVASGQSLTLIAQDAELTTTQAAELLHVSRPFLVRLLDEGRIPHHKLNKHRRVRLADVIEYQQARDQERDALLEELAAEAQAERLGYE